MVGCLNLSESIGPDAKPECDVHMNVDFTWNVQDFASLHPNMTLNDCRHPNDVVLSEDGRWDWLDEEAKN